MFERAKPEAIASARRIPSRNIPILDAANRASAPSQSGPQGEALRAIEWSELTARLGAARDLRLLLRKDMEADASPDKARFADAAAKYFRAREEDQRDVNPIALEQRKASSGMFRKSQGNQSETPNEAEHVAPGDAREER